MEISRPGKGDVGHSRPVAGGQCSDHTPRYRRVRAWRAEDAAPAHRRFRSPRCRLLAISHLVTRHSSNPCCASSTATATTPEPRFRPRPVHELRPWVTPRPMKALTWHGTHDVRVDSVPDPSIEQPTDAIIKVTSTAICGSDLHLYEVLGPY